jgi:hypothetical protein
LNFKIAIYTNASEVAQANTITIKSAALYLLLVVGFMLSVFDYLLLFLKVGNTNKKIKSATPPTTSMPLSAAVCTSLIVSAQAVAAITVNPAVARIDFDNDFIFVAFN